MGIIMEKHIKLRDLYLLFMLFAVCGWIYEVILTLAAYGWFENRGMLYGPWLPIYGFGGLILYFLLHTFLNKPLKLHFAILRLTAIFVCICLICAGVEIAGSYILGLCGIDFMTLWNYSGETMNFEGRIALIPTLRFGILGIVGLYVIVPLWQKLCAVNRRSVPNVIAAVTAFLFFSDMVLSFTKVLWK